MVLEPGAGRPALASGVRLRDVVGRARGLFGVYSTADACALVLLGVLPVVMLLTLDAYGLTYDEEPHLRLGDRVLAFYGSGFQALVGLRKTAYGAGFDLLAALLRRVSPWDEYRTNHILCIFVAQLGLLGTWKLGRLVAGPLAGLLALVLLVLTPVYYGHQFNNPKDIPFAVGYVWGLYAIARLLDASARAGSEVPQLGRRYWLGLAVALGLGMSVRVGGAILVAYLAAFVVLAALDRFRISGAAAARALGGPLLRAAAAAAGGWLIMLAFWPRALSNPVDGPAAALETVTNYTSYNSPTLLDGKVVPSQAVPWDYLPTYFAVQLPELTSLCFIGACIALAVWSLGDLWRRRPLQLLPWLLVVAVLLPPVYAILRGSTLYNGLRHFLFVLPPLCVVAAIAIVALLGGLAQIRRWLWLPAALGLGLLALDPLSALFRLHPHQHVYFNRSSGGLVPAVKNFETEYYGSVYRELHAQLVEEVWRTRPSEYLNETFQITGCGSKLFFTRNLPNNFQYQPMRNLRRVDYYASYVRDRCLNRLRDRRLVTQIARDGATLAVARDMHVLRSPKPAPSR